MKNKIKYLVMFFSFSVMCSNALAYDNSDVVNFCHAQAEVYYSAGEMRNKGASKRDALVSIANAFAAKEEMSKEQKITGMKVASNAVKVVYMTKKAIPSTILSRKAKKVCLENHLNKNA